MIMKIWTTAMWLFALALGVTLSSEAVAGDIVGVWRHESGEAQVRCVKLMASLGDAELTRYAQAHCDIIERFGRFPHRNRALGRETTAAEQAFLHEQRDFGQ